MPDRKPRRMIGRPRAPHPPRDAGIGMLAGGCLGLVVLVIVEIAAVLLLGYVVIEWLLPWVIDVVMDAVEQRD